MDHYKLIDRAVTSLIKRTNFYGNLSLLTKRRRNNNIPTARIFIEGLNLIMEYNEFFLKQFSDDENGCIIQHELEHQLRSHLNKKRHEDLDPIFSLYGSPTTDIDAKTLLEFKYKQQIAAVAVDLEVNSNIPNLPKFFYTYSETGEVHKDPITNEAIKHETVSIETVGKTIPGILTLGPNKPFEEYYKVILDHSEKNGKIDWESIDMHTIADLPQNDIILKTLVKEALKLLSDQERGSLTSNIKDIIEKLFKTPENWKRRLRNIATSVASEVCEETRTRRNRRYGFTQPGETSSDKAVVWIGLDTSGSVSQKQLSLVWSELVAIKKTGVDLWVCDIDCEIQKFEEFNIHDEFVVKGRGGTSFKPFLEAVTDKSYTKKYGVPDAVIVITDGYDGNELKDNFPKMKRTKLFWLIYEDGVNPYPNIGTEIRIRA